MIPTVRGNACVPDLFIAACLQPELEEHGQATTRSFKNIWEGFCHLHEGFGDSFVFCRFDCVVYGLQPTIQQRKKKRLLTFEMMIERTLADTRLCTKIIHTGGSIAAGGK